MRIEILGAESVGVRGLSCVVKVESRKIVIDPGLAGGPPFYLPWLSSRHREMAWSNARQMARHVDTMILDHHLLRCEEGLSWLDRLSSETGHRVICAADFMERPRRLLEAQREQLYEEMPVPEGWHEAYARDDADTRCYRDYVSVEGVT